MALVDGLGRLHRGQYSRQSTSNGWELDISTEPAGFRGAKSAAVMLLNTDSRYPSTSSGTMKLVASDRQYGCSDDRQWFAPANGISCVATDQRHLALVLRDRVVIRNAVHLDDVRDDEWYLNLPSNAEVTSALFCLGKLVLGMSDGRIVIKNKRSYCFPSTFCFPERTFNHSAPVHCLGPGADHSGKGFVVGDSRGFVSFYSISSGGCLRSVSARKLWEFNVLPLYSKARDHKISAAAYHQMRLIVGFESGEVLYYDISKYPHLFSGYGHNPNGYGV